MKRGKSPSPRSTEARSLKINQYWNPKPKLTSRAGGLTWKATFLILSQYHPKKFTKQLRNWRDTLEQYTVTDSNQPSWLKPRPLSPTQRYLPSLIHAIGTPKKDAEMTSFQKNIINEDIYKKLRKKDVHKAYMKNIYHLIVVQTNEQLLERAASDSNFQAVKIDQYPISYLMILKMLCFSNQTDQHPIK